MKSYKACFIYIDDEGLSPQFGWQKYKLANMREFFQHNEDGYLDEHDEDLVIGLSTGDGLLDYELFYYQKDGSLKPFKGWYIPEKNKWCNKNWK